jgi:hypothetical protein
MKRLKLSKARDAITIKDTQRRKYGQGKKPLQHVSASQIGGGKPFWIDLQDYTRKLSQCFPKLVLTFFGAPE